MDGRLQHSCEHITSESNQSRIEQLPNDVLLLILSYAYKTSLRDIARTSILSRRWKNLWHNITCLDFDASTLLPKDRLRKSHAWYIDWVDSVIKSRLAIPQLPHVKEFRIRYELNETRGKHIDPWVNFAIANQVETLHLELCPYNGINHRQYKLSDESWYKAPSGHASLKWLKVLVLFSVDVCKQFVEFILSSCPLLEDLTLDFSGNFKDLDVSGVPPLRLRRLNIRTNTVTLAKLCAPYLTSFFLKSNADFNPLKIDVPMLADLSIGSTCGVQPMEKYLEHFWTYLPQLEKLQLIMLKPEEFSFIPMPKLVKLKYLKICVDWDIDSIFYHIISFLVACPLLETFALQISYEDMIPDRFLSRGDVRRQKCRAEEKRVSFQCLKVLELYGGKGKALEQDVVKYIISKSPNLEKLKIHLKTVMRYPMLCPSKPEDFKVAEAKAKRLCQEIGLETEIMVF